MTFVIAEAGVNHNGALDRALALIDTAADAGADAVKFQTFKASEIVAPGTATAAYQQRNTGEGDQFDMLRRLELSLADWQALAAHCNGRGIEFMSTPFCADALTMLLGLGMRRVKVPSGEVTNLPLLAAIGATQKPVVLSTGMATMAETAEAVAILRDAGTTDLVVLHCTSEYPAPIAEINLRAMATMHAALGVPVGYSDHTQGIHVPVAAVAMGATVIEKHFTLDRTLPGPDHKASLEPDELARMIREIRDIGQALGNGEKMPSPTERETAQLVRRSWHAARPITAGAVIGPEDVALRRPAAGLPPKQSPIGRQATRTIPAGSPITPDTISA